MFTQVLVDGSLNWRELELQLASHFLVVLSAYVLMGQDSTHLFSTVSANKFSKIEQMGTHCWESSYA